MADKQKIGATGNYPLGKLNDSDEGELTLAVSRDGNVVLIDFGKPVTWIAMSPEHAIGLAQVLMKHGGRK